MGDYSREHEGCPQLLDLIPKWAAKRGEERSHGTSEERKLELRLGPPGGEWTIKESNTTTRGERERERLLSLGYLSASPCPQNTVLKPPSPWQHHSLHPSYLHLQHGQGQVAVSKESPQPCSNRAAAEQSAAAAAEKKAFSAANTAVHNTAQKRTAPASVVGWPPIRSFRKNIASKPASDSPDVAPSKVSNSVENGSRTPFVKINMDGIPIGRKVDLKAYDSYEKLSFAVDELFRGLLAAQNKSCGGVIKDDGDGGEMIGGLLDGSGEYTLVYEDHEGDRMLVGDVPWHMFISTVKRLRVLKSSELPTLSRGCKQGKLSLNV
ncbi:auxin-responsive protein IAA2-like [Salvia divinorum]|uniref:Auxin-responsive protein n=1 Tax=Salvia divinorum TaxID=28513 RepID=A0ABD1G2H5_SALDI